MCVLCGNISLEHTVLSRSAERQLRRAERQARRLKKQAARAAKRAERDAEIQAALAAPYEAIPDSGKRPDLTGPVFDEHNNAVRQDQKVTFSLSGGFDDKDSRHIHKLMKQMDEVTGLDFVEAGTGEIGEFAFQQVSIVEEGNDTLLGRSVYRDGDWDVLIKDQDVGLFSNQMWEEYIITHELGHAMGLSHPGKCYGSGKNTAYTTNDTVMSYNVAYNQDGAMNNKFTSQDLAQIKEYWTVSTDEILA